MNPLVEQNIPIPTPGSRKWKFMKDMKVGESVSLPNSQETYSAAGRILRKGNWVSRTEGNQIRIWRIK